MGGGGGRNVILEIGGGGGGIQDQKFQISELRATVCSCC